MTTSMANDMLREGREQSQPLAAVLHVALEPKTGVWSVIKQIASRQEDSGWYRGIGIGVVASSKWPRMYREQFHQLQIRKYHASTIEAFGTAQFLMQRLWRPPIGAWIQDLANETGAEEVIVHLHNAWMSGVFLPVQCPKGKKARAVVTFHGVNPVLQRMPVRRLCHKFMARRLKSNGARLTSVAAASLPLAEKLFGLSPADFEVIPNGVAAKKELSAARWEGKGPFTIGYVGSIEEQKGWRLIVEAVAFLRSRGRDVRLILAGSGPQLETAKGLGQQHPDWLEVLGFVQAPMERVMPRLHALVMMSEYEGLPVVLVEAAAIGLPAVATGVGGVPEIVLNGQTGFWVSRSAEALATQLDVLYNSPELLSRVGQAAREWHRERFDLARVVARYHDVYCRA